MMESSEDGNSCVICYEALALQPVGTAIPCGHLFHQACFEQWERRTTRGRDTKCPMCNSACTHPTFVRIYCNFAVEPAEDTFSLSSGEGDPDENKDFPYPHEEDHSKSAARVPSEVIEILDVHNNEKLKQQRATTNAAADKYKKKAKAMKQQLARLQKEHVELLEKDRKRLNQYSQLQEKLATIETEIEAINEENDERARHLETARYNLSKAAAEKAKFQRDAEQCKKLMLDAQNKLSVMQATYQHQLEEARGSGLAEIGELRNQHRELSTENQRLKLAISRKDSEMKASNRMLGQIQERVGLQAEKSVETMEFEWRKQQKAQMKALKEFRNDRRIEGEQATARGERKDLQNRLLSNPKYSKASGRILLASEKKISKATAILDRIDANVCSSNKKRKVERMPPSIQITKQKKATLVRQLPLPKGPKKLSVQNDIRAMFRRS